MEIADVKRQVVHTIERAKRQAAERRSRADAAGRAYEAFLEQTAIPLLRQVANVLKAQGYAFNVFTPGGAVRLASEKTADDHIELSLDTSGDTPVVLGSTKRTRGGRVIETERPIGEPANVSEGELLEYVLKELEPFVER